METVFEERDRPFPENQDDTSQVPAVLQKIAAVARKYKPTVPSCKVTSEANDDSATGMPHIFAPAYQIPTTREESDTSEDSANIYLDLLLSLIYLLLPEILVDDSATEDDDEPEVPASRQSKCDCQ